MSDKIVIVGGGELAKVILNVINYSGTYDVIGYTDVSETDVSKQISYLGSDKILCDLIKSYPGCNAAIGVGLVKVSNVRNRIFQMLKELGFKLPVIISKNSCIYEGAEIGEGSLIMANAVVNPGTVIGKAALIFSGALIEHDCRVGDFVTFNTGSILAAGTRIGDNSILSVGAIVVHHKNVCSNCFIGAGSVAINDITQEGTYFGIPARKILP